MADYYTMFSFTVPVDHPTEVVAEFETLAFADEDLSDDEIEAHPFYGAAGYEAGAPALVAQDEDGAPHVWVHDDGEADVNVTIEVVKWLLQQPGSPDQISFEWANTCSRPRTDAFGGGAVIVNYDGTIDAFATGWWLHEKLKEVT